MTDARNELVRAEGVARTFGDGPNAVTAVQHATCVLRAGDRVALVGASGSGKSTLIHVLAGLDKPTAGTITWPDLGAHPRATRPGTVAVIFQGTSLLPALDATENVAFPVLLADADEASAERIAVDALARVGLAHVARLLPEELSAGQAQRVAVARAIAGAPRLILADEPTGKLDHVAGALVIDALVAAADDTGAALLVATHDREISARLVSEWRMAEGRLETTEPSCSR